MKNKYFHRSRISEAKFCKIVRHLAMDIDASKTALQTIQTILSIQKIKIMK